MENNVQKNQSWLITALVTVVLFAGTLASEWIATDLEPWIRKSRWIAYGIAGISLIATIYFGVKAARGSAAGATLPTSKRKISIEGSANNSTNIAGDNNTIKS